MKRGDFETRYDEDFPRLDTVSHSSDETPIQPPGLSIEDIGVVEDGYITHQEINRAIRSIFGHENYFLAKTLQQGNKIIEEGLDLVLIDHRIPPSKGNPVEPCGYNLVTRAKDSGAYVLGTSGVEREHLKPRVQVHYDNLDGVIDKSFGEATESLYTTLQEIEA